jgi:hypothetical protein
MNLSVHVVIWAVLGAVVIGLAIYRNLLGIHETIPHVSQGRASGVTEQKEELKKEEVIERWGKWLTVIVVAYGLVLGAAYLYRIWEHGSRVVR